MKIIYWSDYACPYCYIGENRLKEAIEELGKENEIELVMKAFQLDPRAPQKSNGPTLDRFAAKYGISKEKAAVQIESISEMGRRDGLTFNYATTRFTNTMDAHRLTKYAYTKDKQIANRLIEGLFKAYFSDNLELADREVLVKVAVSSGLTKTETDELLNSKILEEEVILDQQEVARYGINGVPFFMIGESKIPGALSKNQMKSTILQALEDEEVKQEEPLSGLNCGDKGCIIG